MADTDIQQALQKQLFVDSAVGVYTILDGVAIRELLVMFWEHKPQHICLYRGELEPDLAQAAPYLVKLEAQSPFTEFVLSGWDKHWGIFFWSKEEIRVLRQHFRKFMMVNGPDGKPLYFRYYDPRVLRAYLPTCNVDDIAAVFGSHVMRFFTEAEQPGAMMRFWLEDDAVQHEQLLLAV